MICDSSDSAFSFQLSAFSLPYCLLSAFSFQLSFFNIVLRDTCMKPQTSRNHLPRFCLYSLPVAFEHVSAACAVCSLNLVASLFGGTVTHILSVQSCSVTRAPQLFSDLQAATQNRQKDCHAGSRSIHHRHSALSVLATREHRHPKAGVAFSDTAK